MKNSLNQLGKKKIPFLFIIDFDLKNFYIAPLDKLDNQIFFSIDGFSNVIPNRHSHPFHLKKKPSVLPDTKRLLTQLSKK
jgi:para-aminobenzoate synthetase component 1